MEYFLIAHLRRTDDSGEQYGVEYMDQCKCNFCPYCGKEKPYG